MNEQAKVPSPQVDAPDLSALAQMAKEGNTVSEEALFRLMTPALQAAAHKVKSEGLSYEDALQEARIGLAKAVRSYDKTRKVPFVAYAATCIRNAAISAKRKAAAQKRAGFKTTSRPSADRFPPSLLDPEAQALQRERQAALLGEMNAQLSPFERQVLLFRTEGKDYRQIAKQLSRTEKAVDNALQRVRRKLCPTTLGKKP